MAGREERREPLEERAARNVERIECSHEQGSIYCYAKKRKGGIGS